MGDPLPFVQLPTSVIRDPGLTVVARMLYAVVATYADLTTREATLLRSTLAKDLNRSRDTVDRAVAELVKAGLLTVTHRKNDKGVSISSLYTLKHPLAAYPQVAGGRTGADTPMGNSAATGMGTPAGMGTGAATPSRMDAATVTAPVRPGSGHGCGTELEPLNENQVTREKTAAAPRRPGDSTQGELIDVPPRAETRDEQTHRLTIGAVLAIEKALGYPLTHRKASIGVFKRHVGGSLQSGHDEVCVAAVLEHFAAQRMAKPSDNQWEEAVAEYMATGNVTGRRTAARQVNGSTADQRVNQGQDVKAKLAARMNATATHELTEGPRR